MFSHEEFTLPAVRLQAENGDAIAALAREDQTTDQLRRENAELQAQLGDITRRLDEKGRAFCSEWWV